MHSGIRTRELASLIHVVSACARVKGFRGRGGGGRGGGANDANGIQSSILKYETCDKIGRFGNSTKGDDGSSNKGSGARDSVAKNFMSCNKYRERA